jgi:hypothetical protein
MASTLPNASVLIGSQQTPSDPTDITTVQTAVAAIIGTMAGIEVKTAGADYLMIGPTSGAGRWLLTFSATKVIHTNQRYNADVELVAGHIWVNYSYDSTLSDIAAAWDTDANVFGTDDQCKFVAMTGVVTVNNIATVDGSVLVSDGGGVEDLQLWFRENATKVYGGKAGAGIAQADDDLADAVTNRIYSIHVTQGVSLQNSIHSTATSWPGFSTSVDNMLALVRLSGAWEDFGIKLVANIPTAQLTTPTGKRAAIRYHAHDASGDYIGWMRNMRVTSDAVFGSAVDDLAGTPIGYAIAYSTTVAADAFALRTGTP